MVTGKLQLAARYDWSDSALNEREEEKVDDFASSLLEHQEVALGANWWFSPHFVLKATYYIVDGNRFAMSEDDDDDEVDTKTNTFIFGASFSF